MKIPLGYPKGFRKQSGTEIGIIKVPFYVLFNFGKESHPSRVSGFPCLSSKTGSNYLHRRLFCKPDLFCIDVAKLVLKG